MKTRTPFLLVLTLLFSLQSFAQQQKGGDIDGEFTSDRSGWSISMPDAKTLAIGSPNSGVNGSNSGQVRIYIWKDTSWVQKGRQIGGEESDNLSGHAISMPDSNTIAIGAWRNFDQRVGPLDSAFGHVRIFRWNGSLWQQKGLDIDGVAGGEQFGYSVSMADSNTISIGAIGNRDVGLGAGQVRNYIWNGSNWSQKGSNIDGESALDFSGFSVSAPDYNTVAIGAPFNDGHRLDAGHVRVYSYGRVSWQQKGMDIDGEEAGDRSGSCVSMPDSNTLAIGSPYNDASGINAGHVRIFRWNGASWQQKGSVIEGDTVSFYFGSSISMVDSNTIAIGSIGSKGNFGFGNYSGTVRVYQWIGSAWIQKGIDINGEGIYDQSGYSVSMPDSVTVAIGAIHNSNGNGNYAGSARVFWFCNTTDTIQLITCDSYTSPSGIYTWTASGTYIDTIPNKNRCDSIITIELTIIKSSTSNLTPITCDSYTSPSGNYTWLTSGIYTDTLLNTFGCDSILIIDLTINDSIVSTITQKACNRYTSPSSKYTWTTSGTYIDTISSSSGCDSVITILLTIDKPNILVSKTRTTIISNASGATYQWLYCDSNYLAVPGETNQSYTPEINGYYAVIVTQNGCTDTSFCEGIFKVGIEEYALEQLKVYPNPSNGKFALRLGTNLQNVTLKVTSTEGKLVTEQLDINDNNIIIDLSRFPDGIYFLYVHLNNKIKEFKLLKQE